MKLLVYRDNYGFVFGPTDKKAEIEAAVKQQEWFIDDQSDLVEKYGKYKLVGEIEGDVFYAWVNDKTAYIESNQSRLKENGYSKAEIKLAASTPLIKKIYKFLGMKLTFFERP